MLERRTFICHRITEKDIDAYLSAHAQALVKRGYSADAVSIEVGAVKSRIVVLTRIHEVAHKRLERNKKRRNPRQNELNKNRDGVYKTNTNLPKGLQKPHNE